MSQGCIVLMCGLPGSGKSTLASMMQSYAAQYHIGDPAVFHILYDNLVPVESIIELIYLKTNQVHNLQHFPVLANVYICDDGIPIKLCNVSRHLHALKHNADVQHLKPEDPTDVCPRYIYLCYQHYYES